MRVNVTFHSGLFAWVSWGSAKSLGLFCAPVGAFDSTSIGASRNLHVVGFVGESFRRMRTT
jgi:hypothetical protein